MSKKAAATTLVVFRRWKDTGSLIALFPELPSDLSSHFCVSYEHVGQHGGADFLGVLKATKPVTADESAPLAQELTRIGYKLKRTKMNHRCAIYRIYFTSEPGRYYAVCANNARIAVRRAKRTQGSLRTYKCRKSTLEVAKIERLDRTGIRHLKGKL
jgi:hypothetical protein